MSTIRVNAIQNTSGVEQYTCKAWVNFNGTGTVAIRASGNVSSITDHGTGSYSVNFTNAMPDANFAALCAAQETMADDGFQNRDAVIDRITTGLVEILTYYPATSQMNDVEGIHVAVFR